MFTSAQLAAYLERIGLSEPRRPTLGALTSVHRAHLDAIPYENLDIHFGRPIRHDRDALFDKLVTHGRGGFCYEQNGLLAHALESLGFEVVRMRGGVDRAVRGDQEWFNHLPLLVRLRKGDYLADTGLGIGFSAPLPLTEGGHRVGSFNFSLRRLDDRVWRCAVDPRVQDLTFDFDLSPRRIDEFAGKCRELETSPDSGFVKTLTVQRPGPETVTVLRSRTLTVFDPKVPDGKSSRVVAESEFADLLTDHFGLGLSEGEVGLLWNKAVEQHEHRLIEDERALSDSTAPVQGR